MTIFGQVEAKHEHCLHNSGGSFNMSAYLQETVCYIGQNEVFVNGEATVKKFFDIEVSAKQIERVCHYYGEQLEEKQKEQIDNGIPNPIQYNKKSTYYAMIDGSMLLTREEGWKEDKLGRIFKAEDNFQINKDRNLISESIYVSHLGSHLEFTEKLEYQLDEINNLAIIADGAKWIWKWADSTYPNATQTLDFFHAKEHLCDFANAYFSDISKKDEWIENQCKLLLNDNVEIVINNLKTLTIPKNQKTEKARQNLISYYQENIKRMKYKTFKEKGLLIGSGAIESAHRHVLQNRLKLSGQRWTIKGLQQIANLRVANKNNLWKNVINMTKNAA